MNRRRFLSMLGIGAAAIVAAPLVSSQANHAVPTQANHVLTDRVDPWSNYTEPAWDTQPIKATIGEYADYANFSEMSIAAAMDESVDNIARELAESMGRKLDRVIEASA